MKTTFQVVTDRHKRKFNIELLPGFSFKVTNNVIEYLPIEIKVNDQLYNFCCEWILCKDRFKRDIIIHDKKLIGCFIISLNADHVMGNMVELVFDYLEIL